MKKIVLAAGVATAAHVAAAQIENGASEPHAGSPARRSWKRKAAQ